MIRYKNGAWVVKKGKVMVEFFDSETQKYIVVDEQTAREWLKSGIAD